MKKEVIIQAKTVEAAVAEGAAKLGVDAAAVTYQVLEAPKKGLFGIGAAPAKVSVSYEEKPEDIALSFVKNLIADMELEAEASVSVGADGEQVISVSGTNAGVLIGHHGDTLDALQYLVNLAANRGEDDDNKYKKITVDVENYRGKREDTLRQLANRMAAKVIKYKKSMTLEPMNPYERRIIHSEIQNIEGVSTNSIGTENNRRIVIYLVNEDGTAATPADGRNPDRQNGDRRRNGGKNGGRNNGRRGDKPASAEAAEAEDTASETVAAENAEPAAEKRERAPRRDGDRRNGGDRNGDRRGRGGRGGRGGDRGDRAPKRPADMPPTHVTLVELPDGTKPVPGEELPKQDTAETTSAKKPYYVRPRNASTRIPAGTQRTYQKPVKKDSVESYFFDLENSNKGLHREKEEPSDIAKACGIYDDPVEETPASTEGNKE